MPVSRPDTPVFSDVHVYYHGAGADTKYVGSVDWFLSGAAEPGTFQSISRSEDRIDRQSGVTGIVTEAQVTTRSCFIATSMTPGRASLFEHSCRLS
jgi:hypothetical protein